MTTSEAKIKIGWRYNGTQLEYTEKTNFLETKSPRLACRWILENKQLISQWFIEE